MVWYCLVITKTMTITNTWTQAAFGHRSLQLLILNLKSKQPRSAFLLITVIQMMQTCPTFIFKYSSKISISAQIGSENILILSTTHSLCLVLPLSTMPHKSCWSFVDHELWYNWINIVISGWDNDWQATGCHCQFSYIDWHLHGWHLWRTPRIFRFFFITPDSEHERQAAKICVSLRRTSC